MKHHKTPWTAAQEQLLRNLYQNSTLSGEEIASQLGRSRSATYLRAQQLNLSRSGQIIKLRKEAFNQSSKGTQFKPGMTPWNKGIKFSPGGRSTTTQFKRGRRNHNEKPIGTLRTAKGNILQIKVSMDGQKSSDRWRSLIETVWVSHNGPVPDRHFVRFRPGMATNNPEEITIDRLECLTRSENIDRNSIHNLPPELRHVVILRGVLNRTIKNREENR